MIEEDDDDDDDEMSDDDNDDDNDEYPRSDRHPISSQRTNQSTIRGTISQINIRTIYFNVISVHCLQTFLFVQPF